jgi:Endonuclease related to archaeal Holliday junction resolvase
MAQHLTNDILRRPRTGQVTGQSPTFSSHTRRTGSAGGDCRQRHLVCKAVNGITLAILAAGGTVIVPLASTVVILLIQRRHDRSEKTDLTAEVQDLRAREQASRDDAVRRSRSTILGDVAQHFAPLLPEFPYNHRDFRWMGECSTGSYSTAWKQAAKSPSSS